MDSDSASRAVTRSVTPEPYTHDCSRRDYFFEPKDGGKRGKMGVFGMGLLGGPYPRTGDYVILRNGDGTTRYRVVAVSIPDFQPDPPGQWFADLEFAPR
jgi:hypothetical protein